MTTKATRDVIDLSIRPVLSVDILGGTIDGTTIGSVTPAPGYFTNLTANSISLTQGGTVTGLNAYYADVAEYYRADDEYAPGTVVKIGGEYEVTASDSAFDVDVFGVVSTKPAFIMNSARDPRDGIWIAVAMVGRVPCRVIGPVRKGQRLATSEVPGAAVALQLEWRGSRRGILTPEQASQIVRGTIGYAHSGITCFFGRSLVDDDREEVRLIEATLVTIK